MSLGLHRLRLPWLLVLLLGASRRMRQEKGAVTAIITELVENLYNSQQLSTANIDKED